MSQLRPTVTLWPLIFVVVGGCIGSGIFISPSKIAAEIPYASLILLLWIAGGLITLAGALTYAELGALFPKAGGVYVYIKEAFGPYPAFLFGWVVLLAVTSGALAALALVFSKFLALLIPMSDTAQLVAAAATIVLTTVANVFGMRVGQALASVFTSLKVLGIIAIVICGLFLSSAPHKIDFHFPPLTGNLVSHFLLALTGIYWSYGGWQHATYISSEVVNPQKNLSRAMIIGTLIVMTAYVLSNMAYLNVLPVDQLKNSQAVAADMMQGVFPKAGSLFIVGVVCISVFGTIAVYTITAPRIYFAMAADKVFFKQLAFVHPKYKTPTFAILLQSAWAIVLLFAWRTFSNLIEYVTFTEGVFLVLAAAALYVIRRRMKGMRASFRTPGYPVTPMIYILLSLAFLVNGMIAKPQQGLAALVLFAAGSVLYFFFRKTVKTTSSLKP